MGGSGNGERRGEDTRVQRGDRRMRVKRGRESAHSWWSGGVTEVAEVTDLRIQVSTIATKLHNWIYCRTTGAYSSTNYRHIQLRLFVSGSRGS